jgi:hypothetical protein
MTVHVLLLLQDMVAHANVHLVGNALAAYVNEFEFEPPGE